ncbi:MAG: beta-L-arabinofuranosidase domain-containing protein [Kiritimatiellia bacterium]
MRNGLAFVVLLASASAGAAVELYPLSQVRLAESSVFAPAVAADIRYVTALDGDRLLAPFRREAGLAKKAEPYGNWESCGLDGHTLGHYLSALANLIASGNDRDGELARRLDYIVDELAACQAAHGDGRLDGVPKGAAVWAALRAGDAGAVWKRWVPWYNVHKTFAGLRDAYELAGNAKARTTLVRLADWAMEVTGRLDTAAMQRMLDLEYGGMNETFADLFRITGERKYLAEARRWEHARVFDPLYRHEDRLSGLHANTQIPKFVGLARTAQLSDDAARWDAADFAWRTIVTRRSVAFGGNSVGEHFHALDSFAKLMGDREGPETCNTYNMLRLTERLFEHDPKAEYAAYYERALFNHLLSSVNVAHPGFVYFTPTRPGHYRVYSTPTNCFWCCVGTGMENPGRYGRFIYAHDGNTLYVNLFVDSELKGILRQTTDFPEGGTTTLTFLAPFTGTVKVREGEAYATHTGTWRKGETIRASRPMDWHVEKLPDGSDWGAILRGPIVMGRDCGRNDLQGLFADDSRMGHVAYGPYVDADKVAYREADAPLDTRGLVPFYRLHECRYQIYWEFASAEKMAARRTAQEKAAAAERERERRTRDRLAPGEQQPETEHEMATAQNSAKGYHAGRHWRHGSWFAYTLDPRGAKDLCLEATYWGGDRGRTFDVLANGVVLKTVTLDGRRGNRFYEETYPIPAEVAALRKDGKIRVAFAASNGGLAGGLFGLRLMSAHP